MELSINDKQINIFSVLRRSEEVDLYNFSDLLQLIKLSDEYQYSGILLFQTNKLNIDPWVFAQVLLSRSENLSPFIAINPVYMHPFTAARMLNSISLFYNRKIFLNFIIGTSKSDQENLNDFLDHDQRYERLSEYINILNALLTIPAPLSISGKYYSITNLRLPSTLPAHLLPAYYIAGSSENAAGIASAFKVTRLQMAKAPDEESIHIKPALGKAVHFGIIARKSYTEAKERLHQLFENGVDEFSRHLLQYSMENTDSVWKKELENLRNVQEGDGKFTMLPFKNSKSDCPYFVGSYSYVANVMAEYILKGTTDFVIELSEPAEDFIHLDHVFVEVKEAIRQKVQTSEENKLDFTF